MKNSKNHNRPKARSSEILTREIPGELLIYDMKRHKAYCLNETAGYIWKQCNGKRTVFQLARKLEASCGDSVDERIVWLALEQLEKNNLLDSRFSSSARSVMTRRKLIRSLGVTSVVALPIVASIIAPTAAQAVTAITQAVCTARHFADPGGCGGTPCSNAPGNCNRLGASNNCNCT
jgi:hypothetical protein